MTDYAVNEWTRDDLPSTIKSHTYGNMHFSRIQEVEAYKSDVVEHLNAHHPKPEFEGYCTCNGYDSGGLVGDCGIALHRAQYRADRAESIADRWRRAHEIVEQERDQARERLREVDTALAKCMSDYQDVEDDRDEWKARAEAAEARTAPIDPVVLVVGESDVEACQVRRRPASSPYGGAGSWEAADQTWLYSEGVTVETLDDEIEVNLRGVMQALAVRRAIEAEQAEDPVEAKAQELRDAARPDAGLAWEAISATAQEQYRRMARHVLSQEAGDE